MEKLCTLIGQKKSKPCNFFLFLNLFWCLPHTIKYVLYSCRFYEEQMVLNKKASLSVLAGFSPVIMKVILFASVQIE